MVKMRNPEEIADFVWNEHGLCHEETMFSDHWTWEQFVEWLNGGESEIEKELKEYKEKNLKQKIRINKLEDKISLNDGLRN
jgi:hypothetical protein